MYTRRDMISFLYHLRHFGGLLYIIIDLEFDVLIEFMFFYDTFNAIV